MARKLIQDIIVKGKTADISRSDSSNGAKNNSEKQPAENSIFEKRQSFKSIFPEKTNRIEKKRVIEDMDMYVESDEKISKNSHIFLWVICIIAVATLLFFVSSIFSTATLIITPKEEPVVLGDVYTITMSTSTANTNTMNASATPALNYHMIALTKNLSQSLQTNGQQNVARKATGKAVIYNNYSSATQRAYK